ncbi:MAG: ATP-binding protein [Gammaproteobacteria bacterium]|nr:ATP-binding protein [Gammaproteobacteria bacterium]
MLLIGPTGVGKTFIAQATGLHACACGMSVLYMTLTTWLENLALARSSGTYLRYRDKLARPELVVIDDFGLRKPRRPRRRICASCSRSDPSTSPLCSPHNCRSITGAR